MCDCIRQKEKMIKESQQISEKHGEVDKVVIPSAFFIEGTPIRAHMEVDVTFTGKKRPKKFGIVLKYCPFCGEKYDMGDEE